MALNEKPKLENIYYPKAVNSFLWFQIGTRVKRCEQEPVYSGKKLVGHRDTTVEATVFKLHGSGPTMEHAEKMALRSRTL